MTMWFFFVFIALVFVTANGVAFTSQMNGSARVLSVIGVNLFAIALLLLWMGAYYEKFRNAGYLVIAHAVLMFSAGSGFMGIGMNGILGGECSFLISEGTRHGLIGKLAVWAEANEACALVSVVLMAFGLFMSWPGLKLLFGIRPRSATTQ